MTLWETNYEQRFQVVVIKGEKVGQILYINSLCLSVCLSEPVHFNPLTVSARPILQPPR